MTKVYECRPSVEDDRPQIDFEDSKNGTNDWLAVGDVIDGTRPITEFPTVSVQVSHPEATQWDCYMDGGVRGLFSQRFVDAVGKAAFRGVMLLPAKVNGTTYYFLRCDTPIDCLDRSKAVFETFRSDPTAVKRITHYAFRNELLPADACFVLPELPDLLLTESVVQRLRAANLRGVSMQPLP
jgi:hypothetical protein